MRNILSKIEIKLLFIICITIILISCNKNLNQSSTNNNYSIVDNQDTNNTLSSKNIDIPSKNSNKYDDYKRIDLSDFIKEDLTYVGIKHKDNGIFLSKAPCKINIKACIKIDKGEGFDDELYDGIAIETNIGINGFNIYYGDYGDEFFGEFHEVERSNEYYKGDKNREFWFYDIRLNQLLGCQHSKPVYISHNSDEFVAEFLNEDKNQTMMRITIKDIYYKTSDPTGTCSEWDLNKDYTFINNNGNHCLFIKELDNEYRYKLNPKFKIHTNENYKTTINNLLEFSYITDDNRILFATRIYNDVEKNIYPKYRIGIGIDSNKWINSKDGKSVSVNPEWDKNSKTIILKENNGNVVATIELDYIKEYKYKNSIENITEGYKKYLSAPTTNPKPVKKIENTNKSFYSNSQNISVASNTSNVGGYSFSEIDLVKTLPEYSEMTYVDQIDTVRFGHYPQSDESGLIKEPIEWIVLEKNGDKALLLSKFILDRVCYNDKMDANTWHNSYIREWLNNSFINTAFNSDEQNIILSSYRSGLDNITNGTNDKVFLLSKEDLEKYLGDDYRKMLVDRHFIYRLGTRRTGYAGDTSLLARNIKPNPNQINNKKLNWHNGNANYWISSPGDSPITTAFVDSVGLVDNIGVDVNTKTLGVRPAIWVKISDSIKEPDNIPNGWKNGHFYINGNIATNQWVKYTHYQYYLDANGNIAKNQWIDNKYYVGENGDMLKNDFAPDGRFVGIYGEYSENAVYEPVLYYFRNQYSVKILDWFDDTKIVGGVGCSKYYYYDFNNNGKDDIFFIGHLASSLEEHDLKRYLEIPFDPYIIAFSYGFSNNIVFEYNYNCYNISKIRYPTIYLPMKNGQILEFRAYNSNIYIVVHGDKDIYRLNRIVDNISTKYYKNSEEISKSEYDKEWEFIVSQLGAPAEIHER